MKLRTLPQRGFAAIAAIFLVVILAALGGFMLTFSNTQQLTSAQDIQGSRAYWVARAGVAWGASSVLTPASAPAVCPSNPPTSVDGFALTVNCTRTAYTEGINTVVLFRFQAQASLGTAGTANYIERSVSASVER